MLLLQARAEGSERVKEMLACGKVCHRLLDCCPHLCKATCHAGPCPGDCSELVTVSSPASWPDSSESKDQTKSTHQSAEELHADHFMQ